MGRFEGRTVVVTGAARGQGRSHAVAFAREGADVAILAVCSGGCVSATEHREALADLQRLRMEAWQRSVEASSLRIALDRAAVRRDGGPHRHDGEQ